MAVLQFTLETETILLKLFCQDAEWAQSFKANS